MPDTAHQHPVPNAFRDAQARLFVTLRMLRRRQADVLREYGNRLADRKANALRNRLNAND